MKNCVPVAINAQPARGVHAAHKLSIHSMCTQLKESQYRNISGTIFGLVALVHLTRLIFGWEITINGWLLPLWVSIIAFVLAGWLGWSACKKPSGMAK